MQLPPLPPTLASVVADALDRGRARQGGFAAFKAALDEDVANAKDFAYRDVAKLAAALKEFDALPAGTPHRTKIAAVLMDVCISASMGGPGELHFLDRAAELADRVQHDPDLPPEWRMACQMLLVRRRAADDGEGAPGFNPRLARSEHDKLREQVEHLPPEARDEMAAVLDLSANLLGHFTAALEGNPGADRESAREFEELKAGLDPASWTHDPAEMLRLLRVISSAFQQRDHEAVREASRLFQDLYDSLSEGHPMRVSMRGASSMVAVYLAIVEETAGAVDPWASVSDAQAEDVERLSQDPSVPASQRATLLTSLAMIQMHRGTRASMDRAVECCDSALRMASTSDMTYSRCLYAAGLTRLARWQTFGDANDRDTLAAGIEYFEKARRHAFEAGNLDVVVGIARDLSQTYLMAGDTDKAVEAAVAGLRGRVWGTLLQPRAADAHLAARDASDDAYHAVSLFLRTNRPDLAAWALEMGRGLIVHAATSGQDIAARLEERGHGDLAREWREATGAAPAASAASATQAPAELRRRVMSALAGVELGADGSFANGFDEAMRMLPDPPSADEIRAALLALGMDALVYLVPGGGGPGDSGVAAVIAVTEHPHWLGLPGLMSGRARRIEEIVGTAARDLSSGNSRRTDVEEMDRMCTWAWDAAIGPLLADLEAPADRPLRVVVIPTRELTGIPWHAARRVVDGRVRYAVEDVVFSYAASARMFCAAAWSGDVPLTDAGLIVSDPDTSRAAPPLPGARVEAAAIRGCFYPGARFLGREADGSEAADGPGLPDEVRSWLAGTGTGPAQAGANGGMLHLACHATVRTSQGDEDTSYLLLHDGERLSAEGLIDALATSKGRDLSLAVLAACRSSESGRGYDEALSLATAFLAHHTRSVVSARWSVADDETSVLMFMLHHFLREKGLRPADALREAQLWALRGDRLPEGAPASLLGVRASGDVRVWGAFVHAGR